MKNTLKLTTAVALALFAGTEASQAHNFKSGFVAGGAVGYSHMTNRFSNSSSNTTRVNGAIVGLTSAGVNSSKSSNAIAGSIFSGYRYITESGFAVGFNLGFGLDGSSVKNSGTVNTMSFTNKLNRQFNITPALFLGKTIGNSWMIFTELGLSVSRFKFKSTHTETAGTNQTTSINKSFTKVGFAPTLGAEFAVNENISVTGTATYEFFGSTKKDLGGTNRSVTVAGPITTSNTTENGVKVKPRYFTMKIGMLYKF